MPLEKSQSALLLNAAVQYHKSLPGSPAARYLEETRGLPLPVVERFRLGYVDTPFCDDHESFVGRLAIPYLRRTAIGDWHVVGMKFRALTDDQFPKFLGLEGAAGRPRLYNTVDALDSEMALAITEGEMDAITASAIVGVPAVGIPGATNWLPSWAVVLRSFPSLWVLADNDRPKPRKNCKQCPEGNCLGHNPGREFAEKVRSEIPHARIVPMPLGEDVNSTVMKRGSAWILERMGLDEPLRT